MDEITIIKPDDFHLYIREGDMMRTVLPHTLRYAGRALIMPNLNPPVSTKEKLIAYRDKIMTVLTELGVHKEGSILPSNFLQMALYLTETLTPEDLIDLISVLCNVVKYYPAGATTNSDSGVTDIKNVFPVLDKMEELDMVLSIHGEVTDPNVDIFEREKVFINQEILKIQNKFPTLKYSGILCFSFTRVMVSLLYASP